MPDDDQVPDDIARLRDSIADELNVQLNMLQHPIHFDDVPQVAYWVAVELTNAYRIEYEGGRSRNGAA